MLDRCDRRTASCVAPDSRVTSRCASSYRTRRVTSCPATPRGAGDPILIAWCRMLIVTRTREREWVMADRANAMRRDYRTGELVESEATRDPLELFLAWFEDATASATIEPNAMVLATVDAVGRPAQRTVLLKGIDARGFTFYSNYRSRKARELDANAQASLLFFWPALERQVRIEGTAVRIDAEESNAYFQSRPRGSQIGAIASPQSEVVPDRAWLAERFAAIEAELAGEEMLTRPEHWGGTRVTPETFEFWQGRPNRLHDRLRYRRGEDGNWVRERLAP